MQDRYQRLYIVAGKEFTNRKEAELRATQLMGKHGPSFIETRMILNGKIIFQTDNTIHLGRKSAEGC